MDFGNASSEYQFEFKYKKLRIKYIQITTKRLWDKYKSCDAS